MTTQEAIKKAEQTNEGFKVIGGGEFERAFCFNMIPKEDGAGFGNGCTYVVYKDMDLANWEPIGSIFDMERLYGKPIADVEV